MLIIVENWNVHQFFEFSLDFKTIWRFDIFKIDAAPGIRDQFDGVNKLIGVFGLDFDINRVDASKTFKQLITVKLLSSIKIAWGEGLYSSPLTSLNNKTVTCQSLIFLYSKLASYGF